ncbi:hypothetical protein WJX77_007042 [Trebouxia sp. C0004]
MSGYMQKTPPSTSGHRVSQYAKPTAGVKRPAEQLSGVKVSAAVDTRQAKFRKLIGDGESKDLDSYREVQSRFNWLEDKLIKDAKGRRPQHQQYDPRTVAVPADAFQKLSDSQKQYWEIKQKYRDVILFFKIGTFYELYEDDAQIGHDILGWKMTITGVGHCRQVGCPEARIDENVAKLTGAGYKVGRVEQVETAAQAKARRGPKAKILRQLTRIHTPATATGALGVDAVHLMAICELDDSYTPADSPMTRHMSSQRSRAHFGFAFLDAAAGRFFVGTATDDAARANLGAILTQVAPKEVLTTKGGSSAATARLLAQPPVPLQLSYVEAGTEFPDAACTLQTLTQQGWLNKLQLPPGLSQHAPAPAYAALSALCAYLKRMKADQELATGAQLVVPYDLYAAALCLDGPTLANLELLEGSGGDAEGSLLAALDTCVSPGGSRLLRQWLCRPLRNIADMNDRLDAVDEIARRGALTGPLRRLLKGMPDLERALGRARNSAAPPVQGLPDWAVRNAQNRRLSALAGAARAVKSAMTALNTLMSGGDDQNGGPVQCNLLIQAAAAVPEQASLPMQAIAAIERSLTYPEPTAKKGKGKAAAAASAATQPQLASQNTSSAATGSDPDSEASPFKQDIIVTTQLLESFNAHSDTWEALESAVSCVDVLASFASFSQSQLGATCRPVLLPPGSGAGGKAIMDIKGLWHPCAVSRVAGDAVVPNDLALGSQQKDGLARALLLTGPNMGGKSTLLRATCLAVVLAQVGCCVPAVSCTLSVADRIFTRLGASDRIMAGESTFMVECSETASILQHATQDSLVVLDELGRGTSTFDGYAIAQAVLKHISSKVDCRLLFATHYHPLTAEFSSNPRVSLGHMAALVGSSGEQGGEQEDGLVFLYKLCRGAAPKSYGLQVARLAGIEADIVSKARLAGQQIENKLQVSFDAEAALPLASQAVSWLHHVLFACNASFATFKEAWQSLQAVPAP